MGVQEEGDPLRLLREQEIPHQDPSRRIQAGGGLVQEDQPGLVDEGLGQSQALPHPLGEGADGASGIGGQPHLFEQLRDPPPQARGIHPGKTAVEPENFLCGEPVREGEAFGQEADLPPGVSIPQGAAPHPSAPGRGADQTQEHLHRGRLPGPVGAQETEDLPLRHPEGEIRHGHPPGELLPQTLRFDGPGARHPQQPSRFTGGSGPTGSAAPDPHRDRRSGRSHDHRSRAGTGPEPSPRSALAWLRGR